MSLAVERADITRLKVDAIVNAANERCLGGGGVDGAIHAAAGPGLLAACEELEEVEEGVRCPKGEARITPGFLLPARYVIHTTGPVYGQEDGREAELLESCYVESLRLADEHGVVSLAFPSISTGAYGYPLQSAAAIATHTVRQYSEEYLKSSIERVIFCTFSQEATGVYQAILDVHA